MAGADGIDADFLQLAQTPFQHLVRHRRAERAGIVMNADALELGRNAVEQKSFGRSKTGRADAERRPWFRPAPFRRI
jgi:hypothetical protein